MMLADACTTIDWAKIVDHIGGAMVGMMLIFCLFGGLGVVQRIFTRGRKD
jgi:hypothetical protein